MKFTVTTEVDPASDTRCGSCPQIRAGKDHDHCRLFDDAVLVFDSGHWRTDKCVIAGQRAELALLRASREKPPTSDLLDLRALELGTLLELKRDVPTLSLRAGDRLRLAQLTRISDSEEGTVIRVHVEGAKELLRLPASHWRLPAVVIEKKVPPLLDLSTVKIGTTCEAEADIRPDGWVPVVSKGSRFVVVKPDGKRVWIKPNDGTTKWLVTALQPARVVKHACPRCDEGMREIIIEWDQDSVQTATRLGADGTAIVEIGSESTIYTPNAYRFVRTDVPPPSEWCDGKGVG